MPICLYSADIFLLFKKKRPRLGKPQRKEYIRTQMSKNSQRTKYTQNDNFKKEKLSVTLCGFHKN